MSSFLKVLAIVTVVVCYTTTLFAQFSGGTGYGKDPYQITTIEELNKIRDYTSYDFILMNDLDFAGSAYDSANSENHEGWLPIDGSASFWGTLNGNGHTISNLYINRPSLRSVGLFGTMTSHSEITNLGLVNCKITGNTNVGAITGQMGVNAKISNCFSTGTVSGTSHTGGLIGYSSSSAIIMNSYSNCNVNGLWSAGGLVGWTSEVTIANCYATGAVTGQTDIGGMVGIQNRSKIVNSYYNVETSTQNDSGKGLGLTSLQMKQGATFTEWNFNTQWVMDEGVSYPKLAWQVPGWGTKVITSIDAKDTVYVYTKAVAPLSFSALPLGNNEEVTYRSLASSLFSVDEDGIVTGVMEGSGKVIISSKKSYLINDTCIVVVEKPFPGGTGYLDDEYEITTIEELNRVRLFLHSAFVLMNDLDFTGTAYDSINGSSEGWLPIGEYKGTFDDNNNAFTGYFNGNGHIIKNLYINRQTDVVGLFGAIVKGEIDSLGLENCRVKGKSTVGGLVAYADEAWIKNSYSKGTVNGYKTVGGFIGETDGATIIKNCYTTCDVSGDLEIGGFIGDNSMGKLYNCYSSGHVEAVKYFGGFIGTGSSLFSIMESCYFDSTTAPITELWKGTAKLPSDLVQQATFVDWDFDTKWSIKEGASYPYLKWETGEFTATSQLEPFAKEGYSLIVAPTPTKDSGKVLVVSEESGKAVFTIFTRSERKLATITKEVVANDELQFTWGVIDKLTPDVYFIEMKVNGEVKAITKIVKIKR